MITKFCARFKLRRVSEIYLQKFCSLPCAQKPNDAEGLRGQLREYELAKRPLRILQISKSHDRDFA